MERRSKKFIICFTFLLLSFGIHRLAEAHPMPNSIINLSVQDTYIQGEIKVPFEELKNALDVNQYDINKTTDVKQYFLSHIKASTQNKQWTIQIDSIYFVDSKDKIIGNFKEGIILYKMFPAKEEDIRNFLFHYDAIIHQVLTHSAIVNIHQDWKNGILQDDQAKQMGIIQMNIPQGKIFPLAVQLEKGGDIKGLKSMFFLGMQHIQEGTDHLLFIITLLIPACLLLHNKKWAAFAGTKKTSLKIIKIVSAFTIGHSLTLLMGTFKLFTIPIQWIEITIAFSIVVSALHAIYPLFYKKESFVAIGFGFIHGLAFSETLRFLNLSNKQLFLSVLGFNIGIEVMQFLIILLIIPWFILLAQTRYFGLVRNVFSSGVMIAAVGWIVQRISNKQNDISNAVDTIFQYPFCLIILLAALSFLAYFFEKKHKKNAH